MTVWSTERPDGEIGQITLSSFPCDKTGNTDYNSKPEISKRGTVNPFSLVGKDFYIRIEIGAAKNLPSTMC